MAELENAYIFYLSLIGSGINSKFELDQKFKSESNLFKESDKGGVIADLLSRYPVDYVSTDLQAHQIFDEAVEKLTQILKEKLL